jgi:serine/threonine-protein kinase RsbW
VTPQHPELVQLNLPARFTYLHLLSDCIADMLRLVDGVSDFETTCYNIQLAAHEICTNIVTHAYGDSGDGRLEISLSLCRQQTPCISIEIVDSGRPFDPESYTPPSLDDVQVHGYGLFLVRQLMDSVIYTAAPGRNCWHLQKTIV